MKTARKLRYEDFVFLFRKINKKYITFFLKQVTRKIRSKLVTEHVNKAVAQRKKWEKFGEEKGKKAGPDLSTTTIGENIPLKLGSNTGKVKYIREKERKKERKEKVVNIYNVECRSCCRRRGQG